MGQAIVISRIPERLRGIRPGLAVVGLIGCSAALRFWAGSLVPAPWIAPDEFVYGLLGRSLYESGDFRILGEPLRFYTLVVPALVGLPLRLGDGALGYTLLKVVQATLMSLAAVPAYIWGRSLMGARWALVAAALTLAVPGLAYSGLIMTEAAFYPISLVAAWMLARALARPTIWRQSVTLLAFSLAAATRLQAVVLIPVLLTAVVVDALLGRCPRKVLSFWPSLVGLAAMTVAWSGWQLRRGGPVTDLLGAYRAAGESHYSVHDVALFIVYHAGDVVLMTGLIPVCAAVLLVVEAARRPEPSAEVRAFLATAVSLAGWFVVEVGIFASRHVGRLAERDLLAVEPLLFLALALWLARGARRSLLPAGLTSAASLLLLVGLPMTKLVSLAALPDAFSIIPLYRLHVHAPSVDLDLVVNVLGTLAALAFLLVPRRMAWSLAASLLIVFAAVSLSASRVVAAQATLVRQSTLGQSNDWIDRAASGRAAYVYTGESYWNAAWESVFWNRQVDSVYDLLSYRVPGPLPQPSIGPLEDGRLALATGREINVPYVVAAEHVAFAGAPIARAPKAALILWRVSSPVRLTLWTQRPQYGIPGPAYPVIRVYACRPGTVHFTLHAFETRDIVLRRNGALYRRLHLDSGQIRDLSIPARPPHPPGTRLCRFDVVTGGEVSIAHVSFEPARSTQIDRAIAR